MQTADAAMVEGRRATSHAAYHADRAHASTNRWHVDRGFPGATADGSGVPWDGLRRWLAHFEKGRWTPSRGDWHCVDPRSMQSRALTCASADGVTGGRATARHVLRESSEPQTSSIYHGAQAIETMRTLDVVGVAELFVESACLFLLAAGTRPPPPTCDCRHPSAPHRLMPAGYAVAEPPSDESKLLGHESAAVGALPADVLRKLDSLISSDAELYLAASGRLMAGLAQAERELRSEGLNVTLLCPDRRAAYERETHYLGAFAMRQFLGGGGESHGFDSLLQRA